MRFQQDQVLGSIPEGLRGPLISEFNKIIKNYREGRWEPAELNGGKFCEVVYSIIRGFVDRKYPQTPAKPKNMVEACIAFEKADAAKVPRAVRIQIPRMLMALYEIRNNRGVGHVGGDVDPNHMDATAVLAMSKWLLAELVRLFHKTDTKTAGAAVDAIIDRTLPIVWSVGDRKRVLNARMNKKDQTLVLLYATPTGATDAELCKWTEHSNLSVFRRDVLRSLHKERKVEFVEESREVMISPLGARHVEAEIQLDL